MDPRLAPLALCILLCGCAAPAAAPSAAPGPAQPALTCPAPCKTLVDPNPDQPREPALAVDPRDERHVLAASMSLAGVMPVAARQQLLLHESRDAGATWTTRPFVLPGAPDAETYDATLVFLPDGSAVLGGLAVDGAYYAGGLAQTQSRVFAARSPAGSLDFPEASIVATGEGAEAQALALDGGARLVALEKPAFALAPDGTLLAAFGARERATPADEERSVMLVSVSRDGGRTWVAASAPEAAGNAMTGAPAVAPEGAWVLPFARFVSVADVRAGNVSCAVAVSRDAGRAWAIADLGACAWLPVVALGPARWEVVYPVGGQAGETLVARGSRDAGATWTAPRVIDAPEAKGATVPALVAMGNGTWIATFFHAIPSGGTSYRAVSFTSEGVAAPIVLDPTITDPPAALGEYFGLVRTRDHEALAAWSGSNGNELAIFCARLLARL
ncbi:MAG: repeat-like domain [Thermoplasmata archaeon]|nr:repeat-like domain [Thermoplasmata archaeon]